MPWTAERPGALRDRPGGGFHGLRGVLRWWPGHVRRRREQDAEAFIALLRRAAALLQAGRRPERIWAELAGLYPACRAVSETTASCCLHHVLVEADVEVLLGEPVFGGIRGPGERRHWGQLAGCLEVSRHAGIPLAGLLDRLADALEEGQDAHQAREAAAAGPRSTARLLGFLPLAGIGMSAGLGASPAELLSGPVGWLVVGTGGGLAVIGHLWTRALIRRSEAAS